MNHQISIAITNYNRSDKAQASVDIFARHFADVVVYDSSEHYTPIINCNHIYVCGRVGAFIAKKEAVQYCKNAWVMVIDSDDLFNDDFCNKFASINLEDNTIYQAVSPIPYNFTYGKKLLYGKEDLKDFNNIRLILMMGNFLIQKENYLSIIHMIEGSSLFKSFKELYADTVYITYHALYAGFKLQLINASYRHVNSMDSYFSKNKGAYREQELALTQSV